MAFTSSYTDRLIQQSEYYYGTPEMTPGLSGSFSGSFQGDGTNLNLASNTTIPSSDPFPFTGDAQITGSLNISGSGGLKVKGPLEISMTASSGNIPLSIKAASDLSTDTIIQVRDDGGSFDLMTFDSEGRFNMRGSSTDAEGAGYYVSQGGVSGEHAKMGFVNGKARLSIAANGAADKFRVFVNGSQTSPMVGLTGRGTLALGTDTSAATLPNEARTNTMFIKTGTAPSTAEADNIQFFAQDVNSVAGTASPTFLTEDNTTIQLGVTSSLVHVEATTFKGNGSQLTNLPASNPFPFEGDAVITGSLEISGSLKMIRPSNKLDLSIGSNIIIGKEAGNSISDNRNAIFLGYKAGYTNTNPNSNIAIGYGAGGSLGTNASQQNIFMGYLAGAGNTSIGSITSRMSAASNNIGMGYQALLYLTSGDQNIALGSAVMRNISTGGNNIAFGAAALYNTNSGDNNIGIGYHAGLNQTTGDGNITIGSGSLGIAGESNQLRIGQGNGDALIHGDFASQSLSINGSGSTVFEVIGSVGTLFAVDDDLSGTLFTANDISGLPVLEASASGEVYIGKSPQSLYTTAVISSTTAATTQSIFGLSTSSYGGAFFDYTVQSGSDARAGSIMSVWNGSNISFTETTTLDIGDTTDFNVIVHISESQAQIASHATNAGYNIKTIIRSI